MILRPRLIVQATTVIWVLFMGGALYASAIWTSYENFSVASDHDRGNGVKPGLDGGVIESPASLSGGQEPPSLPGNPVPLTRGKGGANPPAPGSVRSVPAFRHLTGSLGEGRGSSAQGDHYEVTAYSHGCILPRFGPEGPARRAANGRWPIADLTVAADTRLHPFGTEVIVEGLGFRTVHDRGHAIKGRRLDLFVDTCKAAREFGRRWLRVHTVPDDTTAMGSAQ